MDVHVIRFVPFDRQSPEALGLRKKAHVFCRCFTPASSCLIRRHGVQRGFMRSASYTSSTPRRGTVGAHGPAGGLRGRFPEDPLLRNPDRVEVLHQPADRVTVGGKEPFGPGSALVREKDGLGSVLFWLSVMARQGSGDNRA